MGLSFFARRSLALLVICGLLGAFHAGRADQRLFVWTYQYQTMDAGAGELEYYQTSSTPDIAHRVGTMKVEHQAELEVGMTPRFDFSVYQVFEQPAGASLKYKAMKLRSRYRLGNLEGDWVRPVIYLEYKANQDFIDQKIEFKPILGGGGGALTLALNPKLEWVNKGGTQWEWGYAAAAGYRTGRLAALGLELFGSEKGHYLGPTISHGRHDLWVALGSGFAVGKIEDNEPDFQLRLLVGIEVASGGQE